MSTDQEAARAIRSLTIDDHIIERFLREGQLEWIPWDFARLTLVLSGVHRSIDRPELLLEWCRSGKLKARARKLFVDGVLTKNEHVSPDMWEAVSKQTFAMGFADSGFACSLTDGGASSSVRAVEIEVWGAELYDLLDLDEAEMRDSLCRAKALARPLVGAGPALKLVRSQPSASVVKKMPRGGGSPGKVQIWHTFYQTALLMHEEGRFDDIVAQTEARALVLAEIGEGLSDESIKAPFRFLWVNLWGKA